MERVLINATGAREGGAYSILCAYCSSLANNRNSYFVLSPIKPIDLPSNVTWICRSTSGLNTLIFALFFSLYYYLFFNCNKMVSFSNVNTVFPLKNRVTYFHNILIATASDNKYKLLRFVIRYLNQKSAKFIFQTSFVKDKFFESKLTCFKFDVKWPGVVKKETKSIVMEEVPHLRVLVPIIDIRQEHKNFTLVTEVLKSNDKKINIEFIVTSGESYDFHSDFVSFVGVLNSTEFAGYISACDAVFITSTFETVCLPIFESLCLDTPVIIFNSEYIGGLEVLFGEMKGVHKISEASEFFSVLDYIITCEKEQPLFDIRYTIGHWDF